jgi:hypothetical protein
MAGVISDIRDFVTDIASDARKVVSEVTSKRKIALITGITGQVIIIGNNIEIRSVLLVVFLGRQLSHGISS